MNIKILFNRVKYWLKVHKYHIDDFVFDQTDEDGPIHLFVNCKGERIQITDQHGIMDGMAITDYGVYLKIDRYLSTGRE